MRPFLKNKIDAAMQAATEPLAVPTKTGNIILTHSY